MHPESAKRRTEIAAKAKNAKRQVEAALASLAPTASPYFHRIGKNAIDLLDDTDTFFLAQLDADKVPPRTFAGEGPILLNAENHLELLALPTARALPEMIAKYGTDLRAFG